jgi:hypothetical protein
LADLVEALVMTDSYLQTGSAPGNPAEGNIAAVSLAFANRMADPVRPVARRHFRSALPVGAKAYLSPVTEADQESEALLRRTPDIWRRGRGGDFARTCTWVADPIDGTKGFIIGVLLFGTLISLVKNGRPPLGVIDMPALDEWWSGAEGRTCFGGQFLFLSPAMMLRKRRAEDPPRYIAPSPTWYYKQASSVSLGYGNLPVQPLGQR